MKFFSKKTTHGCQKDTIINEGYTVLNNLPVNRFQCPSLQGC